MASNATTVRQLVATAIETSSLGAVAAQIGIGERDLLEYTKGITPAVTPADRLRVWAEPQLPSQAMNVGGPLRSNNNDQEDNEGEVDELTTTDQAGAAEDDWGFIRDDDAAAAFSPARRRTQRARPSSSPAGGGRPKAATRRDSGASPRVTRTAATPEGVNLDQIRELARTRIDETSERQVQAEIDPGFNLVALRKFLRGSSPYSENRARLVAWYNRIRTGALATDECADSPTAGEGTNNAQWRTVPASVLRPYFATEVERLGSLRAIRRATGLSIRAFQQFLDAATATQDRVLRPLALYYLSKDGKHSDQAPKRGSGRPRGEKRPRRRVVPLEELRAYFREESARVGLQAVVRGSRVSHRSLNRFLSEGVIPRSRVRAGLLDYYFGKDGTLSEPPPPPVRKELSPSVGEDADAPWRSITPGTLRTWYAEESKRVQSAPAVARAVGVGLNSLRRFIAGTAATQEPVLRALATYYLSREGQLSDPENPRIRIEYRRRERRAVTLSYSFPFPAGQIRDYIRARAAQGSLRVVYAEIHADVGLADETVSGFLHETKLPTEKTARKLLAWYSAAVIRSPLSETDVSRRVPMDELHRFYTEAVARAPIEWIAEITAVSAAALENFLGKKGRLQLRTHRNLQLYYIARSGMPADPPPNARAGYCGAAGRTPEEERVHSIRTYARLRAAAITAAAIAKDAGLSASTFYNFLRGNKPIPRIRKKLELWYERDSATTAGRGTLREQLAGSATASMAQEAVSDQTLRAFFHASLKRGTATPTSIAVATKVSPTSLDRFLADGHATQESLERLRDYYAAHALKKAAALDALLEDLDGFVRTRARRRVLSGLTRGYRESGSPSPGWLESLVAQPI